MLHRLLFLATVLLSSTAAYAQTLVGLTDGNTLVRFPATAPGAVLASTPVTGLQAGETLVGLDVQIGRAHV